LAALGLFTVSILTVVRAVILAEEPPAAKAPQEAKLADPEQAKLPPDPRTAPLKDLNGYFPFSPPKTLPEWEKRKAELKRQLQIAVGLWPMPPHDQPPVATIHGAVDRPEYTVERVYFESLPGHYVTGSLYRPKNAVQKRPAVLCPHGHWNNGRFYAASDADMKQQLANGAEQFEIGGRYPLQSRCVQLARMGCVVFFYDMVGYADSQQIPQAIAHGFKQRRPEMEGKENWGFFSAQAELRQQSIMGLQTWNSIRALDWLSSLPDVDASRIGVTGASGGGTQTFILCALDDRPAAAFPAVMVSTAMQGGCTCENCCYLRVGTGNIELAGLIAPRPLGMTAADDWTKEMETKGYPQLRELYALYGKTDNVRLFPFLQYGHNYNSPSRHAMYGFFHEHLNLRANEPIVEKDFQPLTTAEMTVWDDKHPQPAGDPEAERATIRELTKRDGEALKPIFEIRDEKGLGKFREMVGGAVRGMVGREDLDSDVRIWPAVRVDEVRLSELDKNIGAVRTRLKDMDGRELFDIYEFIAKGSKRNNSVVIWLSTANNKAAFTDFEKGVIRPEVKDLLDSGFNVITTNFRSSDLVHNAQYITPRVQGDRDFAGYTYGYNLTEVSREISNVLQLVSMQEQAKQARVVTRIILYSEPGTAHIAAAARAIAGDKIAAAVIQTDGFRFANVERYDDPNFWPGAVKYGDLPAILALSAPQPLLVFGEGGDDARIAAERKAVQNAYRAAGKEGNVIFSSAKPEAAAKEALEWLEKLK